MVKAVVLGAAGGIGQPLSLLLKASPLIDELALYDVVNSPGVAADLSHINTNSVVKGYLKPKEGEDTQLAEALKDATIVVIPAGVPRKPGMSRDDLFNINAGIVRTLATGIAKNCPSAFVLVISNPVNSTVPICYEVLKSVDGFSPKKLFGVTTLDVVRASTFVSQVDPKATATDVVVPVVGGHSGKTIIPLFSQASPSVSIPEKDLDSLTNRVQFGGDEVVKAKDGAGSATLSMAYAGYKFAEAVLKAAKGESGVVQPSFVYLPGVPNGDAVQKEVDGLEFFSTNIELGRDGVVKARSLGNLTDYEKSLLKEAIPELSKNIKKGVDFATSSGSKL